MLTQFFFKTGEITGYVRSQTPRMCGSFCPIPTRSVWKIRSQKISVRSHSKSEKTKVAILHASCLQWSQKMYAIYDIFVGDSIRTGEIGMCRFTGERNRSWIHSILMYESMMILLPGPCSKRGKN